MIKIALEAHPNDDRVFAIYGDFQVSIKQYAEARKYYRKSLDINPNNFKLWQQVLSIDWELQETDSVEVHSDLAIEYFPNQAILYFYSGSSKLFLEEYEEAEAMLNQGLQIVVDPSLKIQFNAQLGDTYYKLDDS